MTPDLHRRVGALPLLARINRSNSPRDICGQKKNVNVFLLAKNIPAGGSCPQQKRRWPGVLPFHCLKLIYEA